MKHAVDKPPRTRRTMKTFWDQKARENALYYISSFQDFGRPDDQEFFRWGQKLALEHLQQTPYVPTGQEVMLEIGCGIGRMTRAFAPLFREVHAVDVSPEMIRKARNTLADFPNVFLYEIDGSSLSLFENRRFDFCYSYLVFQHLPEAALTLSYLREVGRVLKPGGVFRFQLDTSPPKGRLYKMALRTRGYAHDYLSRLTGRRSPTGLHHPAWLGSQVSLPLLMSTLSEAGLALQKLEGENTQYTWATCLRSA